jgi:Flp pilus assembly protein TadD
MPVPKLELAVELTGNDPTIQEHLGDAYRRMGREAEARRLYQTAVDSTASEKQQLRIQNKLRTNDSAHRSHDQNL